MGGNAAEAHPCGFKWVTEALEHRKRSWSCRPALPPLGRGRDYYAPIRVGTDIAFLGGVITGCWPTQGHMDYVKPTPMPRSDPRRLRLQDGLFSGYDRPSAATTRRPGPTSSKGRLRAGRRDAREPALRLAADEEPLQPLHAGGGREGLRHAQGAVPEGAEFIGSTSTPDKVMTICYALGWTQHSHGSQNIPHDAMIQLLLGNIGRRRRRRNALRGHSNVQGITDMCTFSANCRATWWRDRRRHDVRRLRHAPHAEAAAAEPDELRAELPEWFVSLQKAWYGDAATKGERLGLRLAAERDGAYDVMDTFERIHQGKINGFVMQASTRWRRCRQEEGRRRDGQAEVAGGDRAAEDETSEFWIELRQLTTSSRRRSPPR